MRRHVNLALLCGLGGLLAAGPLPGADGASPTCRSLASGTQWATSYYVQDSGRAGPTVMVVAGLHGDEAAGCWAASEIRGWPLTRGRLVVLPEANVPALHANVHRIPGLAKPDGDLDRMFAEPDSQPLTAAAPAPAIWQVVRTEKPDWLVDLHEGLSFRKIDAKSLGSSIRTGGTAQEAAVRSAMLAAVNATISDPDKHFVPAGHLAVGSLGWAAREQLQTRVLVTSTTSKDQPLALRIRQQRLMLRACLGQLQMLERRTAVDCITGHLASDGALRVAVYAGPGTRKGMHHLLEELRALPHSEILPVGAEEIAAGVLQHVQVIIFPGGSSTRQGETLGEANRQRIREFVDRGGGYVGFCAGAYLATTEFPWALKLLDAKTYSPDWKRGRAVVQMQLTAAGRKILGTDQRQCEVRYHNGPILVRAECENLPDYQPLAVFRTEVAEYGAPSGVMIGAPAIVSGRFGQGRVLCFSPHPEQTKGLEELVRSGVRWAAAKKAADRFTGSPPANAKNLAASS